MNRVPASDSDVPCDFCGMINGTRIYKGEFYCADCFERKIEREAKDNGRTS